MLGSPGLMYLLQVSSGRLTAARDRESLLTSLLRFWFWLCLVFVGASGPLQAKTATSDQTTSTQTTSRHHHRRTSTTTTEVKSTSRKSARSTRGSTETLSHHGRRHHNLTAQAPEDAHAARESSSKHGRHHRHEALGKPGAHVTAKKGATHEEAKTSHKESDEAEALEPPSIRVDTDSMMRAYARYDDGVNKRLNGDFAGSISALQEARYIFHEHALQESPMETFAALELGRSAEEAGNYRLARRTYEELKANSPSSLAVRLKLARLEAKNGEIYDALREAREAVNLDPKSAEAHLMLSLILDRSGSAMEAIVEKQRAAELAGQHI
jgi:hypothetical protein